MGNTPRLPWWHALITMGLGVLLSYAAYFNGPKYGFNTWEGLGSLIFWYSLVYLIFRFPLRSTLPVFLRHLRSRAGVLAGSLYVAFHLLLYGFILEVILVRVYAPSFGGVPAAVWVNTNLVLPPNLENTLLGLTYSPSITLSIPPIFGAVLSLYSISAAFIIAVLVVANVGLIREVGSCSLGLKSRVYVGLPVLGVVLGASCCLSPPLLLALVAPVTAAVTYSLPAYYATYFTFPPLAILALYLNQRSVSRLVRRVSREALAH
ncbi:MAG: hypothetical protein QW514_08875 [Thermoprotei archaeon]